MAGIEERVQLISDELSVLSSIFCGKDEFLVNGSQLDANIDPFCRNLVEGKVETLQLSIKIPHTETQLNVSLCKNYPNSLPEISISSTQIIKKKTAEIQSLLRVYANKCLTKLSEPMILKLVEWLQDELSQVRADQIGLPASTKRTKLKDDKMYICVLRFDHMRSRKKYLKVISSWIKEFHLNCFILFWEKHIFAIVEGLRSDINQYLKRARTCTVDVDSAGRPCKERMMDVLCQMESTSQR